MNYFNTVKYNDNLYQIVDPMGVLVTLVIGKEKALLFDTAYGIGNLKEEIDSITNKELIVINSHGHMDHTGGNYQFDHVYIDEADYNLCKKHNNPNRRKRNLESFDRLNLKLDNFDRERYIEKTEGNLKILDFDKLDLGNLDIEIVNLEGHTAGSIGIFIPKMNLLLASDAICPFVWLFLEESLPVSKYLLMLERTLKLPFDHFLVGHGARMFEKRKMVDFYNIANTIDLEKSVKVEFDHFKDLNSYCYSLDKLYDQNGCGIVFDPNKIIGKYFDQHMHSAFSEDSQEDLSEYAKIATSKGIDYICTCEHFDYLTVVDGTSWIADYDKLIDYHKSLKQIYPNLNFLLGIEVGYKRIAYDEIIKTCNKYPFDIIQLSIHDNNKWDYYFKEAFFGQEDESMEEYFDLMLEGMERLPFFDVLSHIDFGFKTIKMYDKNAEFKKWDMRIREVLTLLIKMDKAFEVNTKVQEVISKIDGDDHHIDYLLNLYKELGGKKITLSSDAHTKERYLGSFNKYKKIIYDHGFKKLSFFIKRKEYKYQLNEDNLKEIE